MENEGAEVPDNLGLIGQSEQHDAARGMNTSYYCENCCPGSYAWSIIIPGDTEIAFEVGKTIPYVHIEVQDNCYGVFYQFDTTSRVSWSSTLTSVAVMSGNVVTVIGAGESQIKATFTATAWAAIPCTGGEETPFAADPIFAADSGNGLDFISTFARRPRGPSAEEDLIFVPPLYNRTSTRRSTPAPSVFLPTCGTCVMASATVSPSKKLTVLPTVTIQAIKAVGKNRTAKIRVEVENNPNNASITLTMSATSGTGQAIFTSNNTTTRTITSTTEVEVKGITESSTKRNIRLQATFGNASLPSMNFTVISVSLSLRFGNTNQVSTDNLGRLAYIDRIGTPNLGGPFLSSGTPPILWRHGIEIVGSVLPSDFDELVTIKREIIENRRFSDQTISQLLKNCPDTTPTSFRDDNPLSNDSMGKVYDLDAPGVNLLSTASEGTILRRRTNFRQWAVVTQPLGMQNIEDTVSADVAWFQRISIMQTANGTAIVNDVTGDNIIGSGQTLLTWDLMTGSGTLPSPDPCQ